MISILARKQNWAKATPWMGVITVVLLFANYNVTDPMFWALVNIPLYLFHQTEEHFWPGGFKDYMNRNIYKLPVGEETLTDEKIFWINILLVWLAFTIFGALAFLSIGFGLLILIFSMMNCITHIVEGIRSRRRNPGLVMATIQFVLSIYGAYFVTTKALVNPITWWVGAIVFSVIIHVLLFKVVMAKKHS